MPGARTTAGHEPIWRPSLWVELTPACNLSCSFCYNPWRGPSTGRIPAPKPLAAAEFGALVERIARQQRFDFVALSGGEPLLAGRRLESLVEALVLLDQTTVVTSNGSLMSEARAASLARAGLSAVQIPLHSADPERHDALAGAGSWKSAVLGILQARRARINVACTAVLTARNCHDMEGLVRLLAELGVTSLTLNRLQVVGAATDNPELDPSEDDAQAAILEAATAATAMDGLGLHLVDNKGSSARRPWQRIAIAPDGGVKLCNHSRRYVLKPGETTDENLARLLHQLRHGNIDEHRASVSNCSCLEMSEGALP